MDDAAIVRMLDGLTYGDREVDAVRVAEGVGAHILGNRGPGHELHDEVRGDAPVPMREGEYLRDSRVLQAPKHLRFALESLEDFRVAKAAAQHLDSDRAPRVVLLSRIHDAHAAGPDRMEHEKAAKHGTGAKRSVV